MNFKWIIWLILSLSLIVSIGIVSATDIDNSTISGAIQSGEIDLTKINEETNLEITQNTQFLSQEENSRVIYVGQNKTTDGGNGTEDNPFKSFELACNNISGEKKVEINVYNGTYYLDSNLKFNTSNLIINGIGEVIIKNLRNEAGAYASFGLTSSSANFTFSNLIFDGSNCKYIYGTSQDRYFYVFNGNADLGILYNCTIKYYDEAIMFSSQFNRKFIRCNFLETYNYISSGRWYDGQIIDFEYCVIPNDVYLGNIPLIRNSYLNLTYNNVWFGSNRIDEYLYYDAVNSKGQIVQAKTNFGKYAVFSVHENFVGNNTYEIVGNLTWNDGTNDGIELLNPMIVKISSKTGKINKTAILQNGFFKVNYTSNSQDNEIEIDLDSQENPLEFKNGIQVTANPIFVGDQQIITFTLPQPINTIVNITVNNKTYEVPSNGLSTFDFTVPEELLAGNYQIDAKIIDYKNKVYGTNSTTWTISKVNKTIIVVAPANAYVTDKSINITVLLEKDASGFITVLVDDKNLTKECYGRNIEIDISSLLNPGENDITVIYSGNKKYISQTKENKVFVNKIYPNINITMPSNPKLSGDVNVTVVLPFNASGSIIISVGDKNVSVDNVSDSNIISISSLVSFGFNTLFVRYSGDNFWDSQMKKETIYVDKTTPEMSIASNQTVSKIGENITLCINLPKEASGNLSINGDYLISVGGEETIVNIKCTTLGINHINVTYNGNEKFHSQSKIINITVEKWNISPSEIKITVTNHTTPNFIITLPSETTGNITIKINDKIYTSLLVNGNSNLKIHDLMPDTYNAIVTYSGDDKFNSLSYSISFSVPKPILSAKDINMFYTSGLKYTVLVTASGSLVVGKTITLTINGKKTTAVTDKNGHASVKINLPPKSTKYAVTAEYQGVKITNNVKVNSILQVKNLKVKKSAKTLKIKVTLKKVNNKYLKGKKITLKFKGKKYSAKTNKKGVTIFKINKKILKKLKVGKKYKYQVNYLKDTANRKLIIKK